ncbi:MAG: hypothetical protein SGBAC_003073 [Bacillariaceae sp.]
MESVLCFLLLALALKECKGQTEECSQEDIVANSFVACWVQNSVACGECGAGSFSPNFQPGVKMPCSEAEDQMCPSIRCCEECWETTQAYTQCTVVGPSITGGVMEEGCILDCTRFPIGAANAPVSPPTPTMTAPTPTMTAPTPSGTTGGETPTPVDMPTPPTCDQDALQKEYDDCIETKGCYNDIACAQSFAGIQYDESNINDICAYFEPAICVVESCCSDCADEFKKSLSCATAEGSLFECGTLSCGNALGGGGGSNNSDSGATTSMVVAYKIIALLGLTFTSTFI